MNAYVMQMYEEGRRIEIDAALSVYRCILHSKEQIPRISVASLNFNHGDAIAFLKDTMFDIWFRKETGSTFQEVFNIDERDTFYETYIAAFDNQFFLMLKSIWSELGFVFVDESEKIEEHPEVINSPVVSVW